MAGGALLALNRRIAGGILVLLSFCFLLATQDNPLITEFIKPKPRSDAIKYEDLARHVSVMGAVLFLMVVPADPDVDPDHEKSKKKRKQKDE